MNSFNFDFNHGATKAVDDPRSERDASDRINAWIDAAFFRRRGEEAKREYVGASAIGDDCLRKIQFGYLNIRPDPGRIKGNVLRIFETGHVFEAAVADWLRFAGFDLQTTDPATGRQYGFSVLGGKGKGHLDGILRAGPVPLSYPTLWECKALNEKGWQSVKKSGLAIAKPLYAAQVAIDQAYLGLHANPAVFSVLNKNTEELHHELVPFDRELAQRMSDRMALVIQSTEQQQLLPRAYASDDNWNCRHMCDFYNSCWSLKR
jgi:hypothetical protein